MVLGRDITKIPCFRDSALYGIYSGLGTLLLTLMATSRPPLAADVGLGIFCAVTTGSFLFCRHQRQKTTQMIIDAQNARKEMFNTENNVDES